MGKNNIWVSLQCGYNEDSYNIIKLYIKLHIILYYYIVFNSMVQKMATNTSSSSLLNVLIQYKADACMGKKNPNAVRVVSSEKLPTKAHWAATSEDPRLQRLTYGSASTSELQLDTDWLVSTFGRGVWCCLYVMLIADHQTLCMTLTLNVGSLHMHHVYLSSLYVTGTSTKQVSFCYTILQLLHLFFLQRD